MSELEAFEAMVLALGSRDEKRQVRIQQGRRLAAERGET